MIIDLEQPDKSPEDLMLSSVTGEGTQERAETEVWELKKLNL